MGRFVVDPLEFVERHLDGPEGFTLVADVDHCVVAALIVRLPADAEDNLARDLGCDEATVDAAAHIESVAVAEPHRGEGLQRALLGSAEAELLRRRVPAVFATVAPDNAPSLRNFLGAGYIELARREKYGGLSRIVVGKRVV